MDELENEEIPAHIREARMGELKSELQRMNEHQRKGYGTYRYTFLTLCVSTNFVGLRRVVFEEGVGT